jgi:hypothetical protein
VYTAFGNRDYFKGNWLLRAAGAKIGIYANDAEEAMYPKTRDDGEGQPLDASKHNYTLTFPAGQFPPVNAFWSVTMYDGQSQLLIKNPQPLPHQLPNASGHEEKFRRLAHPLHPKGESRRG